jgi:hypothetical protein
MSKNQPLQNGEPTEYSTIIPVRLKPETVNEMNRMRGGVRKSTWIRKILEKVTGTEDL